MRSKKFISLILAGAFLLAGCKAKDTQVTAAPTVTAATSETTTETTVKQKFEYNPHPYSKKLSERIPQENWDALYNLSDAIRKGETTFKCANEEAYKWCTDITVLCCLIPPAGTKIEGKSDDGSPAFENGTGKIHYNMPVDEYVKRQADFEKMIEDILNSNIEFDDTEYEKALKLYLYVAENYVYGEMTEKERVDGYVYLSFINKKGVCENFGSVYAYLLLQSGVDAFCIGCFDKNCHAWTYAVINGQGYHIDTTWALKGDREGIYLDYFMMSDNEREKDDCPVGDLTGPLIPQYWANHTSWKLPAKDDRYNIREWCYFKSLDEEKKILHYIDMYNEPREFRYGEVK